MTLPISPGHSGYGLLAHNLLKMLAYRRARTLVVASLAIHGPQPLRELTRTTGISSRRIENQLIAGKRCGALRYYGRKRSAVWALQSQSYTAAPPAPPASRPSTPTRRPVNGIGHSTSWWITPSRETFQRAAQDRALRAGWDA